MLLGRPLVIGRSASGEAFALQDACPHRGIPLSYGHFDGTAIECAYHGWQFEALSGRCLKIPSLTSDATLKVERICARGFPSREADGFFWVFVPDDDGRAVDTLELPPPPRVPTFSERFVLTHLALELPCTMDHGIIGLMDPAHGPFVHQSWWWRGRHSIHEKAKRFEPIPNGFRMSAHQPSANSAPYKLMRLAGGGSAEGLRTTIDFVLPNMRFEVVRFGQAWFSTLTTVTPIDRDVCRIDVRAAWNIFRWATPLVLPIGRFFGKKFIAQDQRTMERQAEGLKTQPSLMLIDDADRPAKWYFQLKQALLDSRRDKTEMTHPLKAPVILRWRS